MGGASQFLNKGQARAFFNAKTPSCRKGRKAKQWSAILRPHKQRVAAMRRKRRKKRSDSSAIGFLRLLRFFAAKLFVFKIQKVWAWMGSVLCHFVFCGQWFGDYPPKASWNLNFAPFAYPLGVRWLPDGWVKPPRHCGGRAMRIFIRQRWRRFTVKTKRISWPRACL